MEFGEKLQDLRKKSGLTQEELARELYVSRTAVSKWESGRGYPSIESLKQIGKYFSVPIDTLLSSEEALNIAEEDNKQKENHFYDIIFGLLDLSVILLLFLPVFASRTEEIIQGVSLIYLKGVLLYLKISYFAIVILTVLVGILFLALQNCKQGFWQMNKLKISLAINVIGILAFVISLQPYPAVLLLAFAIIKVSILIKKR